LIALVCSAAFLFAEYIYTQSPAFGYSAQSVLRDFKNTYKQGTLLNLLTFQGNVASPQISLGYLDPTNVGNEISIIIPIIAFASLYWILKFPQKRNRIIAMLMSVSLTSLFIFTIRYITYSQFDWIIMDMPLLWTLRNPIKLQLMLAVCMIPLFIYSMEKLAISSIRFLRKRNPKFFALTFTLVFLGVSQVYVYNSSVINGYVGLDRTYATPLSYVPNPTITKIVDDSLNWYEEGTYRGIILPFDHYTELQVQFTNPLLYPSILGLNSEVTNEINNELEANSNLKNFFSLLSTKYVYVNKRWNNTDFPIIQPKTLTDVTENLKKENLTEDSHGEYSRFVIDTALPSVYLSSYPVFCSSIKTIELLNDTVFYSNPVFLNMQYAISEMNLSDSSAPMIFGSYSWDMPFQGTFNLYATVAAVQSNNTEIPIYYSLDGGEIHKATVQAKLGELEYIATLELKQGSHKLMLTPQTDPIVYDTSSFSGGGPWTLQNNLLKINNGTIFTSQNYTNFDLNVKFKPVRYGAETWNGPELFVWTNSSCYWRLIFHKDGLLELSQQNGNTYNEGIVLRAANVTADSWNFLRLTKNINTISMELNGVMLLTYTDQSISTLGKIGFGSDNSETDFEDATVSKNIIEGLGMIPNEAPKDTPEMQVRLDSGKYSLKFNQTSDSGVMVFLGESYDQLWEATIDGKVLSSHSEANMYGNSWFTNVTQGTHEIQIYYKPNEMYRNLLYMNIVIVGILLIAAYFPIIVLNKLRFLRWKTAGKKLIRKT
jgi:hypothetical protein